MIGFSALFLSLGLTLPSPVLALRNLQPSQAGLEELRGALSGPDQQTGLEEAVRRLHDRSLDWVRAVRLGNGSITVIDLTRELPGMDQALLSLDQVEKILLANPLAVIYLRGGPRSNVAFLGYLPQNSSAEVVHEMTEALAGRLDAITAVPPERKSILSQMGNTYPDLVAALREYNPRFVRVSFQGQPAPDPFLVIRQRDVSTEFDKRFNQALKKQSVFPKDPTQSRFNIHLFQDSGMLPLTDGMEILLPAGKLSAEVEVVADVPSAGLEEQLGIFEGKGLVKAIFAQIKQTKKNKDAGRLKRIPRPDTLQISLLNEAYARSLQTTWEILLHEADPSGWRDRISKGLREIRVDSGSWRLGVDRSRNEDGNLVLYFSLTLPSNQQFFRVEPRPDFSIETTGFLLKGEGIAFAPILALLEIQGVFFDRRFAGIVQTQAEKGRLLNRFAEITEMREILEQRLVVVEEQRGATDEERYHQAEARARAHLFGLAVSEIDRLLPDWIAQLNAMLKTVGYQLPDDPTAREAARALLYAA